MKIKWKKFLTNALIWLAAEIILNSMGIDTLADYSEFIFSNNYISRLS